MAATEAAAEIASAATVSASYDSTATFASAAVDAEVLNSATAG